MTPARYRSLFLGVLAAIALLAMNGQWVVAAAPDAAGDQGPARSAEQIAQWIGELDSDQFHVRERAAENLRQLAEEPAAQSTLAATLYRVLLAAETSYEVRALCEPLLWKLPPPSDEPQAAAPVAEIDRLLVQADAPTYSARIGAAVRLAWIAKRNPDRAYEISERVKRRLADPQLPADSRQRLVLVREVAWINWLSSDPASWPAPVAGDAEIAAWIDTLASDAATKAAHEAADRELTDLLAYEALTAKIRDQLGERLARGDLTPAANERISKLEQLSRPAMAAEIWENYSHRTVQYLLVGVAQYPERMKRATYFDRIDEKTAHCVSGNSLEPGDYPVGVAIPPTNKDREIDKQGRMFHLVNLPTVRRHLLYDHQQLRVDELRRLREISERTIDWMLARKECLSEREIVMLRQLHPSVVSRMVGPYLLAVDDAPKLEPEDFPLGGPNSRHALFCAVIADIGTHEAIAGLVEAARRGRTPAPQLKELRFNIAWLAALLIAERDPWPGVDEFLVSLIEVEEPLNVAQQPPADVGGTAAAMLLERHGMSTVDFGVSEVNDTELRGVGVPAARFTLPEGRKKLLTWWQRQKPPAKPGA